MPGSTTYPRQESYNVVEKTEIQWTYHCVNVLCILTALIPSKVPFVIQRDVLVCEQSDS